MTAHSIPEHIALATAQLDKLILMHRDIKAELGPDVTRDQFIELCIRSFIDSPPQTMREFESVATVAVIAVDRLADQQPPDMPTF